FIAGVDEFDPLFFNISPADAEYIDPQERLFLQHAWMAMEDAGYTRAGLQVPYAQDLPGQVGVYVGVMYTEYQLFGAEATAQGRRLGIVGSAASIANRVSYALNLHGPSMTLDTMCSSSLTAIHIACQDLKQGRTSLAIAGGVNVTIHPNKYLVLSAGQFISGDGHCQSFGEGGDGYIPGEGVGVVVLKRLLEAKRDGDHIYGIIRGSALTHGGKTNGYSVPNPQAQTSAVSRALSEARIDPRHISYIEAHGTGTKLGDPIEIAALSRAFHQYTRDTEFCRIGSAKSNIGHTESAAGIAGLTKVLLQMQHQQIVPSLHSAQLNPHIDFPNSPFIVNQSTTAWEPPVIEGRKLPRIAGISSFGAGGSNAHMLVEEYQPPVRPPMAVASAVILLTAKAPEQLRQKALDLLAFIQPRLNSIDLVDMAYTLQVGREAMEQRLGLVVSSVAQLVAKLQAWVAGDEGIEDVHQGQVKRNNETLSLFSDDADLQQTVDKWVAGRKFSKLLDLWVKGLDVDWSSLYSETKPSRVSLPTYPFAREHYWIDIAAGAPLAAREAATVVLHPLLHRNTSDFSEQRYSSTFTGEEFFLADHQVTANGDASQKVLPGVVYLEMARAAVEQSLPARSESMSVELLNTVWTQPIVVSEKRQVSITLVPNDNDEIDYEIYTDDGESAIIHCQGRAIVGHAPAPAPLDLAQLETEMGEGVWEPARVYAACARLGLVYGPSFQGITAVHQGSHQLLAHLRLPAAAEALASAYVLHPSLMDGALQAAVGLIGDSPAQSGEARLPFALDTLRVVSPCTAEMVAWLRYAPGSGAEDPVVKLDIDLCDERGNICVQMRGFSSRVVGSALRPAAGAKLATSDWEARDISESGQTDDAEQHVEPRADLAAAAPGIDNESLAERTQDFLRKQFSGLLKMPFHKIDPHAALEQYGIDSILAMKLTSALEKTFGSLSKTLFFEYQTIRELAEYFVAGHAAQLTVLLAPDAKGEKAGPATAQPEFLDSKKRIPRRRFSRMGSAASGATAEADPIAIIGLSGRYPEAPDLEAYWENLREGKDCITEVPKDRWDWREYFSDDRSKRGHHLSKWGGFISGVDEFDPLFFNMSPLEAELVDPQERLFLQHAWMAMEDAGYTRASLQVPDEQELAGQVGVYVGVMYSEYQLFGAEASMRGKRLGVPGSPASIANRVSYALNLHGPSMTLDTMCSSSLTAIHVACLELKLGRTSVALAGGVNVTIHPNKYLVLSAGQFLSSDGHCQSFGEGGDGYIPGEGVGVVVLKRLSEAKRDGDHIYGVIRGSALNHGGKTNGYTVPNPQAQTGAIRRALAESRTDPRHISYVEAHGTGTKLGDPIEIAALSKAFHDQTQDVDSV
ncbi:MAG TPA: beta-ketoacyl synthase N-terminal-like domain-containing protein, partial [Thermoanaerobaculia bacterium]|nr:beta-ketoacyl synthase N-terminal-like domain-containing protein [Thermoanaerobaculia bacterium]